MCSQSAPAAIIRCASVANIAKSEDSMDGAIFGAKAMMVCRAVDNNLLLKYHVLRDPEFLQASAWVDATRVNFARTVAILGKFC